MKEDGLPSALTRKLQAFVDLSADDRSAIDALCRNRATRHAGEDLIVQGERPRHVFLLCRGWGYRYKLLPDGGRQIMAYLVPGDLCDLHIFVLRQMDHSIGLLSDAEVATISEPVIQELLDHRPQIARALSWSTLVDEATLREWLVNTLRREPFERVAHLLYELYLRLKAVGLAEGDQFDFPLTQPELGDTMGLNAVTINRVLQRLRREKVIALEGRKLTMLDGARMREIASFDSSYLHLERLKG